MGGLICYLSLLTTQISTPYGFKKAYSGQQMHSVHLAKLISLVGVDFFPGGMWIQDGSVIGGTYACMTTLIYHAVLCNELTPLPLTTNNNRRLRIYIQRYIGPVSVNCLNSMPIHLIQVLNCQVGLGIKQALLL